MATAARLLAHVLSGDRRTPAALQRKTLIIVAQGRLGRDELRLLFPQLQRGVIIRDVATSDPLAERSGGSALRLNEVRWDPQLPEGFDRDDARQLRSAGSTAVFLKPYGDASGRMLRDLRRAGVRWVIFDEHGRWLRAPLAQALVGKVRLDGAVPGADTRPGLQHLASAIDRTALRVVRAVAMPGAASERPQAEHDAVRQFAAVWRETQRPAPVPPTGKQVRRIMHFVSSLDSGGAERQVVSLAIAQRHAGLVAAVRTQTPLSGQHAHYAPLLAEAGVEARQAGALDVAALDALTDDLRTSGRLARLVRAAPAVIRDGVLDVVADLLSHPPDVLHCWLDEPNVLGGIAGLIAGVPRIVLSTRNVGPAHFPHLHKPWMRPCYRLLAGEPRIVLAGNSKAGIEDYARWIGIEPHRFVLLRNAVSPEAFQAPAATETTAVREALGVAPLQPLVVGVMRLSQEKRPDVFVEVIRRLRLVHADCTAAIVGVGPLADALRRRIQSLKLDSAVQLLGQRRDVRTLLAAADVVLLTSDHEGTPNCVLEALALGKGVVATDAGGTAEVLEHERTGLLAECGDVGALSAAVSRLITSPALAEQFGRAGREAIRERFSLPAILERTLATYIR